MTDPWRPCPPTVTPLRVAVLQNKKKQKTKKKHVSICLLCIISIDAKKRRNRFHCRHQSRRRRRRHRPQQRGRQRRRQGRRQGRRQRPRQRHQRRQRRRRSRRQRPPQSRRREHRQGRRQRRRQQRRQGRRQRAREVPRRQSRRRGRQQRPRPIKLYASIIDQTARPRPSTLGSEPRLTAAGRRTQSADAAARVGGACPTEVENCTTAGRRRQGGREGC